MGCLCISCSVCLTLCDPRDYNPLSSSAHGILQVRILQANFLIRGSNPGLKNLGLLHCRQILYHMNHLGSPTGSKVLGKASGGGSWEGQFKGASSSSLVASNIWLSDSLSFDFWEVVWTEPQNSLSWEKRREYLVISFYPRLVQG